MGQNSYGNDHGNTPAAWTAVIIMIIGFVVGAIAVILLNWPLFWIGGVGVVVLGAIVGKVMQMMGMGGRCRPSRMRLAFQPRWTTSPRPWTPGGPVVTSRRLLSVR